MERYFFFDIDGTLTTPLTADYPDSAREAVRRLQEKGNFVAIASGRLQADAVDVAEELGIDSVISDGGNGVTCCGKILFYTGLKPLPMISLEFSIMIKAVGSCWRMKLRRRMA